MKVLVAGATGATGKRLVHQLLKMGAEVKLIVRPSSNIPETWKADDRVTVIKANIHEISVDAMAEHLKDCQAAASCLGHNLSFRGIYGKPRRLVTDAVKLICNAIVKNAPEVPVKFVLMNTTGNRNKDLNEPRSIGERIIIGLLRVVLPPHPDNEQAAEYLRVTIGQTHPTIRWVAVRPDTLIKAEEVTPYTLHASPTRSGIFNPGKTSRMNVGNFMASLIMEPDLWSTWEGKMPVIYNVESE